ncbi:unnamed protein product [Rhodiola kirilowii]
MSSSSSSQAGLIFSNNGYALYPSNNPLDHLHHQVFNTDMSTASTMDDWGCGGGMVNTPPPMMFSPYHSENISTGYLQDVLVEFSSRPSKRRRLLLYADEPSSSSNYHHSDKMSYWSNNSNCISWGDLTGDLNWMMMMDHQNYLDRVSDEHMSSSVGDEANMLISSYDEMNLSNLEKPPNSYCRRSNSSHSASDKSIPSRSLVPTTSPDNEESQGRVGVKGVAAPAPAKRIHVYPFALVKPGGVEGDMTINDINERILMPPVRPVRHPVGDFACRPCVSPHGPGLSGKAVVALTKIQTQGRGTITIIRTRG